MPERGYLMPDEKLMRAIHNINLVKYSSIESTRKAFVVRAEGGPGTCRHKGGGPRWSVFKLLSTINNYFKEKMTTLQIKHKPDSHRVNLLVRAAGWVREKGQVRPISEDPVLEESIGILFNIVRRRRKVTLENLEILSGFAMEELVAFEAGLLPRLRMCKMLPNLAKIMGITNEELFKVSNQNTNRFFDV